MEKICCFAGHALLLEAESTVRARLEAAVRGLIVGEGVREFLSGGMGEFDRLAERCVRRFREEYRDVRLCLVIPYLTRSIQQIQGYDDIICPTFLAGMHPRAAIVQRNRWMVAQADWVVCYVRNATGGAASTRRYAVRQGRRVLDLA